MNRGRRGGKRRNGRRGVGMEGKGRRNGEGGHKGGFRGAF